MTRYTIPWVFDDGKLVTMSACPHTALREDLHLAAGRFPIANLFHYFKNNSWNHSDFKRLLNGIEDRPRRYAYNIGTWNDADYWTGWPGNTYGFDNLFHYVHPLVMADAQQGRVLLVIDNLNEGFYDTRLYAFLHQSCALFNLPPKTICFMTGNELDPRGYAAWCDQQGITDRITVIGFPHLMYMQQINLINTAPLSWSDHVSAKQRWRSIADFNCLNRISRNHRELFIMQLIDRGLHTRGLISHNRLAYHDWPEHGVPQTVIDQAESLLPLVADDADFDNNKAMHINQDIYLRSWCSVITETHAFDQPHNLFISEKLWKPIYALQPFMVWGHRGTLAQLRSWGFETFSSLWDESYDDLPDLQRMHAILDNIQGLSVIKDKAGWLEQAKEICEHNQQHFVSLDWFDSSYHDQFVSAFNRLNN